MSKGLTYWLNSGANIHPSRKDSITWDDLGLTEAEWDALSDDEQEEIGRELALERADWGYTKDDE